MPLNSPLLLHGRLERGPSLLQLQEADGGRWEVETRCRHDDLFGRDVVLEGTRSGFNRIVADRLWVADEEEPRTPYPDIELIVLVGLSLTSILVLAATLVGLLF